MYRVFGKILMNAPLNSDSQRYSSATEPGTTTAPAGYAPSVPISVYRELATELKTTQTTLDALTQQNQQLLRQNTLLRTEIQRFVQAAEQLGHFAGVVPQEPPAPPPERAAVARLQEQPLHADLFANPSAPPAEPTPHPSELRAHPSMSEPTFQASGSSRREEAVRATERSAAAANSAIVPHAKAKKRDRPHAPHHDPKKHRLFTEHPESMHPMSRVASRSDMGNLWLATTILLVVVSAFGAGFLIMRPLLSR